jgi:hypothetical protein
MNIAKYALRDVVHGRSVFPEWHVILQYMLNCNFIYARKKSTMFHKPIFIKLANSGQRDGKISYT